MYGYPPSTTEFLLETRNSQQPTIKMCCVFTTLISGSRIGRISIVGSYLTLEIKTIVSIPNFGENKYITHYKLLDLNLICLR